MNPCTSAGPWIHLSSHFIALAKRLSRKAWVKSLLNKKTLCGLRTPRIYLLTHFFKKGNEGISFNLYLLKAYHIKRNKKIKRIKEKLGDQHTNHNCCHSLNVYWGKFLRLRKSKNAFSVPSSWLTVCLDTQSSLVIIPTQNFEGIAPFSLTF